MMTRDQARLLVVESEQRRTILLRRFSTRARPLPVSSVQLLRDALARWPASFVWLAESRLSPEARLQLLLEMRAKYPQAVFCIQLEPAEADLKTVFLLAGAVCVTIHGDDLPRMLAMVQCHVRRLPRRARTLQQWLRDKLPWQA